jgi:hypothetical protein
MRIHSLVLGLSRARGGPNLATFVRELDSLQMHRLRFVGAYDRHHLDLRANIRCGTHASQISLLPGRARCTLLPMSFRPVRKIAGIGNVFLGTELVDIAEYDLEIYEENPEDHEHHGAAWTPGAK